MSRISFSITLTALLFLSQLASANTLKNTESEGDAENFCVDHGDCPPRFECIQLECVSLTPGVCRKDSDCNYENGMYCETETSTCRYFCLNDYDCENGEYCDTGNWHCLPREEGDADSFCTSDADCDEATEYCDTITHTCRPNCISSDDCPEGWACFDYRCQPESPGDLDWDMPWLDYEEWAPETPEIPDWEMPEVRIDEDLEPEADIEHHEYAESGGFGESGIITDGDKDKDAGSAESSSSSCTQTGGSDARLLTALLPLLALLRRRRA